MRERLKPQPTQLDSSKNRGQKNLLAEKVSRPIASRKKRQPKLYAPRWFESSWSQNPDLY